MPAPVGQHVRPQRGAQERQIDAVAQNAHAILAIVKQGAAATFFGQGCPFMLADLESGSIVLPGPVRGPMQMPELYFVDRFIGMHIDWKCHLEQLVTLLPIQHRNKIHLRTAAPQRNILGHLRFPNGPGQTHCPEQWAAGDDFDAGRSRDLHRLLLVHAVDIPSVPVARDILIKLEAVAGTSREFAVGLFVP